MTIKEGYGGKSTHIKVHARNEDGQRKAEVWIEQEGVQHWLLGATMRKAAEGKTYKDFTVLQDQNGDRFVQGEAITKIQGQETLAYVTLDELLTLRDELSAVIQELVK